MGYDIRMATIKEMRAELGLASRGGYADQVRQISGIAGAPADATEVFILYLALESVRQPAGSYRRAAYKACQALKDYNE